MNTQLSVAQAFAHLTQYKTRREAFERAVAQVEQYIEDKGYTDREIKAAHIPEFHRDAMGRIFRGFDFDYEFPLATDGHKINVFADMKRTAVGGLFFNFQITVPTIANSERASKENVAVMLDMEHATWTDFSNEAHNILSNWHSVEHSTENDVLMWAEKYREVIKLVKQLDDMNDCFAQANGWNPRHTLGIDKWWARDDF